MKKKIILGSFLAIVIMFSLPCVSSFQAQVIEKEEANTNNIESQGLNGDYVSREPIYIGSDEEFTAENGVTSGSGTQNDPYVIEGWEIDLSQSQNPQESGITIEGGFIIKITKYFEIRNCYIHDGYDDRYDGIEIHLIKKGRCKLIDRCKLTNNWVGMDLYGDEITVTNCEVYNGWDGVFIVGAYCIIDHCNISNNVFDGIGMLPRTILTITNCNIKYNKMGICQLEKSRFTILNINNNNICYNDHRQLQAYKTFGRAKNNYWGNLNPYKAIYPLITVFLLWPYPNLESPNPNAGPQ